MLLNSLIHWPVSTVKPLVNGHLWKPPCISSAAREGTRRQQQARLWNAVSTKKPNARKSQTFSTQGPLCRRRCFRLKFSCLFSLIPRSGVTSFCVTMQRFSFSLHYQPAENVVRILLGNNPCVNNLWYSPTTTCSLHDINLTLKLWLFIKQLHMKAQRGCRSTDLQKQSVLRNLN